VDRIFQCFGRTLPGLWQLQLFERNDPFRVPTGAAWRVHGEAAYRGHARCSKAPFDLDFDGDAMGLCPFSLG
jgi:hypothetical protein